MPWTVQESLLGFARALRAAGLPVTAAHERLFLQAAAEVGISAREQVYWAGRCTLTGSPDDVVPFDEIFASWFGGASFETLTRRPSPLPSGLQAPLVDGAESVLRLSGSPAPAVASTTEVLRHRDIGVMGAAERQELRRLLATLDPRPPRRRARRHTAARRGDLDGPRTLREQRRRMGEVGPVVYRRKRLRNRRTVVLLDVSGSMRPYADSNLRLAHRMLHAAPRTTEVFTMGTRLTRVTRALRPRTADQALVAAGDVVPDWAGGTRLGEMLRAFVDRWGRGGLARQAVVVVFSDGWERQEPELLGEQARRLRALAHCVIWVSPHRGKAGYQPVQQGIMAVLPHIDHFVAGHSLAAFAELLDAVAQA
ncbi:VWA domain-containing protein [Georgenia yuyongxinii]|uniref:vWA domain-containing protein n=1 Tax=Georgenia yuyongxinii TaxID=2589797 RepID=UPI0026A0BF76